MGNSGAAGEPFAERWGRVKAAWGWLGLALLALTYGLGSLIQHELQPFLSVWQIAWVTLPLTIAVAIVSVLALLGHLTLGRAFFTIIATCVASILTGLTAGRDVYAYLFQAQYHCFATIQGSPEACYRTGYYSHANGNPVISILAAYLHLYGWAGCLKAVLVGTFVGYAVCLIGNLGRRGAAARRPGRPVSRPG